MKIRNLIRWTLAQLSIVTMVSMPVTQGVAAQRQQQEISKAMVQNALKDMGLNKSMTYGEFFKKNKDKYPVRIQKQLAPYFAQFSQTPMPQFDVSTAKGSDGLMHPVLRISQNGQLYNVQFFGETERYAKFDNTNLTEIDLINFDDMLIRLAAGDAKKNQQLNGQVSADSGFPMVSKETWTRMSATDRASYVINLREVWEDSRKVIAEKEKINFKKKNKSGKKYSWFSPILMAEAQAQAQTTSEDVLADFEDPKPPPADSKPGAAPAKRSAPVAGNTCIVAGYVSTYVKKGKGLVCSISKIIASNEIAGAYIGDTNYNKANDAGEVKKSKACDNDAGFYACNPLVYGTPNGKAICINKSSAEFQKATWWQANTGSSCDQQSRLTTSQIQLPGNNQTKAYYADAAEKAKVQALADQKAKNFEMSKNFINGLLAFKGFKQLTTKNDPLGPNVFEQIKVIRNNFNEDIANARSYCSSQVENKNEKNFWGACDQLHKRFLFVAELLSEVPGCENKKPVDSETLLCSCDPATTDAVAVPPGSKCNPKVGPTPTPTSTPTPAATPVPSVGICDPACTGDQKCLKTDTSANGAEVWECVGRTVKPPKKKGTSWFMKALPWIAGAGVIAAMYFLWKPKIPKLKGAGDICPNGLVAPCGVQCAAPKVFVSGSGCSCAACPPGQTIVNLNACECGTSNPGQIICADGTTVVTDISLCPASTFTCWDGSVVSNPINCPERPPAASGTSNKVNTGK